MSPPPALICQGRLVLFLGIVATNIINRPLEEHANEVRLQLCLKRGRFNR